VEAEERGELEGVGKYRKVRICRRNKHAREMKVIKEI
jgi:hypothetical protein